MRDYDVEGFPLHDFFILFFLFTRNETIWEILERKRLGFSITDDMTDEHYDIMVQRWLLKFKIPLVCLCRLHWSRPSY